MKAIHYPLVDRGIFKGECCGFRRERITMERPSLGQHTFNDAIDEFYRNSKCDCARASKETEIGEYLENMVSKIEIKDLVMAKPKPQDESDVDEILDEVMTDDMKWGSSE